MNVILGNCSNYYVQNPGMILKSVRFESIIKVKTVIPILTEIKLVKSIWALFDFSLIFVITKER